MIAISLLSLCLLAAGPTAADGQAVMNAENEFKTAVIKADRAALEKILSPDLSYTHSSAKTQTKAEFIQDATGGATKYESIEFENTKLRQYGTTIVVTHDAVIKTVQTGTMKLYVTEVWAQQAGRWQMVSRQATKLP